MNDINNDGEIVRRIAMNFFHVREGFSVKIVGEGACNINYLVEGPPARVVIKLSKPYREYKAFEEYRKEKWCIQKAQERGIPTPKVLDVNQFESRSYQIQSYIEGTPVADLSGDSSFSQEVLMKVWYALGEYAKKIHSVSVTGWGENLIDDTGKFADSWEKYVRYNIDSLGGEDELIKMGVLNEQTSRNVGRIFESLLAKNFTFGLCHNDIALRNTIVDSSGTIYLLDWGTARAEVVPHCDLNEILSSSKPDNTMLQAFLDGYGLSADEFQDMKSELDALELLHAIDTLRWAIDKKMENLGEYVARAKDVIAYLPARY
ncbi:MAG: aminoglycoside phosphotransferase family protein [Candidatus Uhrbacteria bacterium]|nr:aminoglycoside phosphotransferase family protein [Candidatus Uhrbacteria bacterium]